MTEPIASLWNCTNAEYHGDTSRVGRSMLADLMLDPALYHGRYIAKTIPRDDTDALRLGAAFHDLIAGESPRIVEVPPDVLTSNGQRRGSKWDEFCAAHEGATLLLPGDMARLQAMVGSVRSRPSARRLIDARPALCEQGIAWTDPTTGIACKARPDLIVEIGDTTFVVDFKTTASVLLRDVASTAERFGYHRQAAWYSDAVRLLGADNVSAVFVFVGKQPPHTCRLVDLEEDWIERGARENRDALDELAWRLRDNDWDIAGADDVITLESPRWAKYAEEYLYGE